MENRESKIANLNKTISLVKLIPNIITITALCIGISAIRFALDDKWEQAVLCTIFAALLDGIDGRIARLLNASSVFGAELDSLCDFVNFGLVPVLITYLWIFDDYNIRIFSWSAVLFYSVCSASRLARFNTMAIQNVQKNRYFIGVPSPIGAILVLLPLINEFDIKNYTNFSFHSHPYIIGLYQFTIGILLACRIPTFALKDISIKPQYLWLFLIVISSIAISLFLFSWYMIPFLSIIYVFSIPLSFFEYKKQQMSK